MVASKGVALTLEMEDALDAWESGSKFGELHEMRESAGQGVGMDAPALAAEAAAGPPAAAATMPPF